MIAIDIPHPGATYYGANNYEAGLIGGRYLGRWVKEHWYSEIDEILLLELKRAGNLPRMRLSGMLVGINLVLPSAANCRVTYLEGDGELGPSFEAVRRHLRSSHAKHVLVGAINDPKRAGSAARISGSRACRELRGHGPECVTRGKGRTASNRRFSVRAAQLAYFHRRYGENLIRVSLDILNQRPVPPAVFINAQADNSEHGKSLLSKRRFSTTGSNGAIRLIPPASVALNSCSFRVGWLSLYLPSDIFSDGSLLIWLSSCKASALQNELRTGAACRVSSTKSSGSDNGLPNNDLASIRDGRG